MHKVIVYLLCLFCVFSKSLADDNNNDSEHLNINDKDLEEILKLIENDHTAPSTTPIEEPYNNNQTNQNNEKNQNDQNNKNNSDNQNNKNNEILSPNKENYDDINKAIEQTDKNDLINNNDENIDPLEKKILSDFQSSNLVISVTSGILVLYQKINNIFLYPILLLFLFIILILFLISTIYIYILYKNDKIEKIKFFLFYYIFLITLIFDLLFLLYESFKFTLAFFIFSKDISLCLITFFIGIFLGRKFLKSDFEKRIIP